MKKIIWVFSDENGHLNPFLTFDEAHKYAFEIYDKNLKFVSKMNGIWFYENSWNEEEVCIHKLDLRKLNKKKKSK